jgi:hypothetical protein
MNAAILCIILALIAVVSNAQTPCAPNKFCSNIAAIAGRYDTAQSCITACGGGKWTSYASSTGWCGCASSCASTIPNPGYQTYCPGTFAPTATPTASPTATPTASPTLGINKCFPGQYCNWQMNVQNGQVATPTACGNICNGLGSKFYTYVPTSKWCACAPAGGCSTSTRITNPYADSYCL